MKFLPVYNPTTEYINVYGISSFEIEQDTIDNTLKWAVYAKYPINDDDSYDCYYRVSGFFEDRNDARSELKNIITSINE